VAYAFSASGHSTDITAAMHWLKARGALTVAVTAAHASAPLVDLADTVYRLNCSDEMAAPATKSFTAQLFAAAAIAGYPLAQAAEQAADAMDALVPGETVKSLATFLQGGRTVAWVARGPSCAGALDAALKAQ